MDDESEPKSLGAYENMEGPEVRPDFDAEAEGEDTSKKNNTGQTASNIAKRALRNGEDNATKSAGKAAGKATAGKAAEIGLNAATGGVAGTALKVAEKVGVADKIKPGTILPGKIGLKKAAPLLAIIAVIVVLYILLSFTGQSLFAIAFVSRMKQSWNSTSWSNHEITDYQTNNSQLAEAETSEFGDVVFNEMGFTDDQIRSFEQAGLEYEEGEDGTKALVHHDINGKKVYIVADKAVSGEAYIKNNAVANNDQTVSDSGIDAEREAENIAKLTVALDVEEGGRIMKFSEAIKDRFIRREYITATNSWRGDMAGWFNEMAETVTTRLGISRNNWKEFKTTGDNDADEKAVIEKAKELPSATEASDAKSVSYKEMVKDISEKSGNPGCGTSSAFSAIESVANADQTARQVSAGSLWLESIDKTVAGEGTGAPMNAATNIVVRSGGADTEGMHYLFGSEKMDQGNEVVQAVSAQAHGSKNSGTINFGAIEGETETYQTCIYEGDIQDHGKAGPISAIGSMFKRIGSWIVQRAADVLAYIKSWFSSTVEGASDKILAALNPTIQRFEKMRELAYFNGEDTKLLGEAMVSSTERILSEKAKSGGQTVGDTGAAKIAYRLQQEVIAEQAEYDRDTKSQFDPTSEHTFLGKIAYSLIPFATSTSSISLTSTVSTLGNLVSKSMASLLPTSSAISEAELAISQGECVQSNSIAGFSNAHCNDYRTFDIDEIQKSPAKVFDDVARMRFDDGGYQYALSIYEAKIAEVDEGIARMPNEPDYGNEPLNPAESEMPLHWSPKGELGEGTPNGCESDWEYKLVPKSYNADGTVAEWEKYYYWDYPTQWSYSRITNFEYNGYKTGWPNRISEDEAGREEAKNDEDPGGCMLDLSIGKEKQPVINKRGAYHLFNLLSGQRGSETGVSDYTNAKLVAKNDFLKGRIHPCLVGAKDCTTYSEKYDWTGDPDHDISSKTMYRWIGGSSYVFSTGDTAMMQKGYKSDDIFKDPTREGMPPLWDEAKLYQAYTENLEWLENIGIISKSSAYEKVAEHYEDNPLDNSYEGILARFSGLKKDAVIAVLNLVNYSEFLANYDPTNLYPLGAPAEATLEYDNMEIVAKAEKAIQSAGIVYDELRNRAIAV